MLSWKTNVSLIALIFCVTSCGGGGGSSSSSSSTGSNSLGPLVNAEGGSSGPGSQVIIGDQCLDNPKMLTVDVLGIQSQWPFSGNPRSNTNPLVIYTGPTQDPSDLERTLIQFEVKIKHENATIDDDMVINLVDVTDPEVSITSIGLSQGLIVSSVPLSQNWTSLARFYDTDIPGYLDLIPPPGYADWNSYLPGQKIIAVQVCFATINLDGQPLANVGSTPIYLEIRPGTGP